MNDSRHLNIIPKPQKTINQPITLLVLCTNALEHHAILKNMVAQERYVYKSEAYISGTMKGRREDIRLILREPEKRNADLKAKTLQATQLFQPQFAFLLGMAAATEKTAAGEVLISNTNRKSQAEILAISPEANGFFQALQSKPEVPGMALLSIYKSAEEGTSQALENLVTATLNAWQQIDCK